VAVAHNDVLQAERDQQLDNGDTGRAGAAGDHADFVKLLAGQLQRVEHSRKSNDGGAVLVVVENRDIAALFQFSFNFKATRRRDIFQIYPAEAACEQTDSVDDIVNFFGPNAERNRVHVAESLKQGAFAFHNGHARFGADVSESEHRGAVGNNRDKVGAAG